MIPFNKPFLTGKETKYIREAVKSGKISGDGIFSKKCEQFFESKYNFKKCLLTTSCTDALEICALLLEIEPGDEVIIPSYTFVSTANAFALRGAKIIFADSRKDHPGINEVLIEKLITKKTKAIVVVHYAGIACDMDKVMQIASAHNIMVIEDAAQAIDSYYISGDGSKNPLGSIGHLAAFSFHETKNIIAGEGGMLVINDERFIKRAEILREKGTNRNAFFRGEVDKYNWVDIGSSFLPSDIIAAFLFAQLENLEKIQRKRIKLWNTYNLTLAKSNLPFTTPVVPTYACNNGHMYYLVFNNEKLRNQTISQLKDNGVMAVFHYQALHNSPYFLSNNPYQPKPESERYSDCLLRLPMFNSLRKTEQVKICDIVTDSFK